MILDGTREPILSRDVVFNKSRAAETASRGRNWTKSWESKLREFMGQLHHPGTDDSQTRTEIEVTLTEDQVEDVGNKDKHLSASQSLERPAPTTPKYRRLHNCKLAPEGSETEMST